LGNREEAEHFIEELKNIDRPYLFGNDIYWQACITAIVNEKEQAMELLRQSIAKGIPYTRLYTDMDLEPLWDYSPFIEMLKPKDHK
jgi:hypothetical protein